MANRGVETGIWITINKESGTVGYEGTQPFHQKPFPLAREKGSGRLVVMRGWGSGLIAVEARSQASPSRVSDENRRSLLYLRVNGGLAKVGADLEEVETVFKKVRGDFGIEDGRFSLSRQVAVIRGNRMVFYEGVDEGRDIGIWEYRELNPNNDHVGNGKV